jgi:hypothetical protein
VAIDQPLRGGVEPRIETDRHEPSRFRRTQWSQLAAIVLVVLALSPVIAVLITRVGRDYVPTGDVGLIDTRVRDVLSTHPPLVGPYSRYGWSHPGPLMFFLIAIPSAITGQAAWATLVGGALLQGIAIVWLAWLAWRRGGLPLLAAAMVGISLIYVTTGPWVVLEPWNPHIAIAFFALFAFQAWLFATGDHRVLFGAAITGTFLVQTHVGYAPLVVVVVAVAGVYAYFDIRWGRVDSSVLRSRVKRTVIVVVLLWTPALIEMVQHPPGNLPRVASYFVRSKNAEPALGLLGGAQLLAAEFRWLPAWLGGSDFFDPLTHRANASPLLHLVLPVALLVVGLSVARRTRTSDAQRFLVMVAALLAAAPLILANVTGVPYPYLFYWRPVIAVMLALGVGGALWSAGWIRGWLATMLVPIAVLLVAFGSGRIGIEALTHDKAVSTYEAATASLSSQLKDHGMPPRGVILRIDTQSLIALQRGIFNELDRDGLPVHTDPALGFEFGDHRARESNEVDAVWWVAERGSIVDQLSSMPGASLIAYSTPLDPQDEAEVRQIQRELLAQLTAAGRLDLAAQLDNELVAFTLADVPGIDDAAAGRLGELNAKVARAESCRCGVVAFSSNDAPDGLPW